MNNVQRCHVEGNDWAIVPSDGGNLVHFADFEQAIGNTSVAAFREGYETGISESLPTDAIAEGVRLLQMIGLDITYTDAGLEVIAAQIVRQGVVSERQRIRAGVEALDGDFSCDVGSHLDVGTVLAVIDGEDQR